MLVSLVIRTLNEAQYLDELLSEVARQQTQGFDHEVVLIDSGSTDDTVAIARRHGARITTISREEFSFGRSLNRGSEFARGDILVYVSGHCIPVGTNWLQTLCQPLIDGVASYSYGRQVGDETSNYSECRIFAKYFPSVSRIPQEGFFCNNANSALLRSAWEADNFNEDLTGLEDMELAKRLVGKGHKVAYVAEAPVYHLHSETWTQVRRRFEREALALQRIMPEIHLRLIDVVSYVISSVFMDAVSAARRGRMWKNLYPILRYRLAQFRGSYAGNRDHRLISDQRKRVFFYPHVSERDVPDASGSRRSNRGTVAYESKQPAGEG